MFNISLFFHCAPLDIFIFIIMFTFLMFSSFLFGICSLSFLSLFVIIFIFISQHKTSEHVQCCTHEQHISQPSCAEVLWCASRCIDVPCACEPPTSPPPKPKWARVYRGSPAGTHTCAAESKMTLHSESQLVRACVALRQWCGCLVDL